MVMHWHHSKDKFMAYLLPLVEKRLKEHRGDLDTPEDEVCSVPTEVVSGYGTDTLFKAKRRCCMDDREDAPSVAPLHRPAPDGAHIRSNASAANGKFTPSPPPVQPLNLIQLLMFALYNLCKHSEYLEPLRREALQASSWECDNQNTEMPLLDSFIKETARMEPGSLSTSPISQQTRLAVHRS